MMTQKELESDQYELKLLELHKQHKITLDLKALRDIAQKNVTMFRNFSLYETGVSDVEESNKWVDYYQRVLVEIDAIEKQSAI